MLTPSLPSPRLDSRNSPDFRYCKSTGTALVFCDPRHPWTVISVVMPFHSPNPETDTEAELLRFPTSVDRWLAVIAAIYVLVAIGLPAWHLGQVVAGGAVFQPILAVLPPMVLALLWILTVPCYYELRHSSLIARSGIVRVTVPFLAITRIRRTRTLVSAPAWSLNRLAISYGKTQQLIISPERQDDFLRAIQQRAPHLEWVNDELVALDD